MSEHCRLFGSTSSLVGVVNLPDEGIDSNRPALITLNAGLVHRVGPHRLHVKLARRLEASGFVAVRYDMSGLGDSLTRTDNLPYMEGIMQEVQEVMDAVTAMTGIESFCLIGLSSGALLSMRTALRDPRVVGVGLLNPHGFVHTDEWNAHIRNLSSARIYASNLLKPRSWLKAMTGRTNYRRLAQSAYYRIASIIRRPQEVASSAEQVRDELEQLFRLDSRILLLFSGSDRSIDNFHQLFGASWRQKLGSRVTEVTIPEANHTFADPVHQREAIEAVMQWMRQGWARSGEEHRQPV